MTGRRTVAAVLVAAGSGERLGAGVPKAFCRVAGRTLLEHAVARFGGHPDVRDVLVAAPAALVASAAALVPFAGVVAGGRTRQESVARALSQLRGDVEFVLVHDVARAFTPAEVISRVLAALVAGAHAVVPTVPVTDTVRRIEQPSGSLGGTVERSSLVAVQTPQGFTRAALLDAHAHASTSDASDDAVLVEARGVTVVAVPGSDEAFKITTPWDLALAEAVAAGG
ncbi:MAG: 2-C-methyl-D-erythritol 4-phosphate cytidylyltransferase [Jatrophihabitantaceae bacterium]